MANLKYKLSVPKLPGESVGAASARAALKPTVQAAVTVAQSAKQIFSDLTLNELTEELAEQARLASSGDLTRMESMLVAQSHTLDQLFHKLTRRALLNIGEYSQTAERYMKLALRAQAQCRANAEALHEMKHPRPVAFVHQANISHGPQQVNNGRGASELEPVRVPTCAGKNKNKPDELLEATDDDQLDTRSKRTAAARNTALETLATVYRAKDARG